MVEFGEDVAERDAQGVADNLLRVPPGVRGHVRVQRGECIALVRAGRGGGKGAGG